VHKVLAEGADPRRDKSLVAAIAEPGTYGNIHTALRNRDLLAAKVVQPDKTFRHVAEEWLAVRAPEWTDRTLQAHRGRLKNHTYPAFGGKPIKTITPLMVIRMLKKFEGEDRDTSSLEARDKTLQQTKAIFAYASMYAYVETDPLANFDNRGAALQRRRGKLKARKYKALAWDLLPKFWIELATYNGNTGEHSSGQGGIHPTIQILIKLQILTLARPGEVRLGTWDEIKWDERQWHFSAERMKMDRDHIVPLSRQALGLLKQLHSMTGDCKHMFPKLEAKRTGFDDNKTLSENTARDAVRAMGYDCGLHGFRHMASTFLNSWEIGKEGEEIGMWDSLWIEYALSHIDPNKMRRTYNAYDYMKARTRMLQFYADQIIPKPTLTSVQTA
jgi:integrase